MRLSAMTDSKLIGEYRKLRKFQSATSDHWEYYKAQIKRKQFEREISKRANRSYRHMSRLDGVITRCDDEY